MKNGSTKRTISRVLAFVMLVSAMFTNIISANADVNDVLGADDVISAASAVVDDIVDSDVEDLAAVPADVAAATQFLSYEDAPLSAEDKLPYESTNDFFKVVGTALNRINSDHTAVQGIELNKADGGSIQFTVDTASDVILYLGSTSSGNESAWAIEEVSTAAVKGSGVVSGTSKTAQTWSGNVPAGTYKIYSPLDATRDRGVRVYYIGVTPAAGGSTGEVTQPTTAEPPQGGGDTGNWVAHEQTGLPVSPEAADLNYPLDAAYDGVVKVDIEFTYTSADGKFSKGNLLGLKSIKTDTSTEEIDHEAFLRITDAATGAAVIGRSDSGAAAGNVINGKNTLTFIIDTATNEVKASLNGGAEVTRQNRTDKTAANVGYIKAAANRPVSIEKVTVYTPKEGGSTGEETTEPTTAPTTQPQQPAGEKEVKVSVSATPASIDLDTATDKTVKVDFYINENSADKGFNNYTAFVNFDPAVLKPISASNGTIKLAEQAADAVGTMHDVYASNFENIIAQFSEKPAAGDTDFPTANGTSTQAELGRIKIADVVYSGFDFNVPANSGLALPKFTDNGVLFSITFEAIGTGDTNVGIEFGTLNTVTKELEEVAKLDVAPAQTPVSVTGTQGGGEDDNMLDPLLDCPQSLPIQAYAANTADAGGIKGLTFTQNMDVKDDAAAPFTDATGKELIYSKAEDVGNCIAAAANGEALTFVPEVDGTVKIAFKVSSGDKVATVFGETITSGSVSLYEYREYPVTAGQTYTAGIAGSKIRIFYFGFTPSSGGEGTTEPPTEGTTAKPEGEETKPAPEGFKIQADNYVVHVADTAKEATIPVKVYNHPGISNYIIKIDYTGKTLGANIKATDGNTGDFKYDATIGPDVKSMIEYIPVQGDPDYAPAVPSGTDKASDIGVIRYAAVATEDVPTATNPATVLNLKFTVPAGTPEGQYPIKISSVTVGLDGQTLAPEVDYDAYIEVVKPGSVEPPTQGTTEAPTQGTTEAPTQGTTAAPTQGTTETPSETTTTSSRGHGGGGGTYRPPVVTTTEAAPEATTAEKSEGVTKDVEGNKVSINPPTEQKPFDGFTDIGGYGWAEDAINRLASLGIITGIGDRMFGPSLPCRRCDFAILINKALGLSVSATPKNFYDNVDTSKYYYNDVLIGYNAGILSGYGNNYFKPEQYCTREEMFVLVAKTLEYLGEDVTSTSQDVLNKYVDVADISWWSAPYCAFLTDAGIVTGTPGGYAEPDRLINRAEMAVMINKDYDYALEVLAKQMKTGTQANAELLDEAAEGSDAAEATTVEGATEETTEATEEATEADAEATTAEAETEATTEAAAE